jgi:hypothetical protein
LDVQGRAKIRELPLNNNLNRVVVANNEGVLYTRAASTFKGTNDDWYAVGGAPTINGDIYHTGNVGIGTNNQPQHQLHVKGYVEIDDSAQTPVGNLQNLQVKSTANLTVVKWLRIYVDGEMYCIPLFRCVGIE